MYKVCVDDTEGASRLQCPVKNDRPRQRKTGGGRQRGTWRRNELVLAEQSAIYRLTIVTNLSSRRRGRSVPFRFRCLVRLLSSGDEQQKIPVPSSRPR